MMGNTIQLLLTGLFASNSVAQSCKSSYAETDPTIIAPGFSAYVLARNLKSPRGLVFDKEGNLVVLEKSKGITTIKLREDGGCPSIEYRATIVNDITVN
jgi:glucose/arabinose dehydrogenase